MAVGAHLSHHSTIRRRHPRIWRRGARPHSHHHRHPLTTPCCVRMRRRVPALACASHAGESTDLPRPVISAENASDAPWHPRADGRSVRLCHGWWAPPPCGLRCALARAPPLSALRRSVLRRAASLHRAHRPRANSTVGARRPPRLSTLSAHVSQSLALARRALPAQASSSCMRARSGPSSRCTSLGSSTRRS